MKQRERLVKRMQIYNLKEVPIFEDVSFLFQYFVRYGPQLRIRLVLGHS